MSATQISASRSDDQPTPAKHQAAGPPRRWLSIFTRDESSPGELVRRRATHFMWLLAVAAVAWPALIISVGNDGARVHAEQTQIQRQQRDTETHRRQAVMDDELAATMTRLGCVAPALWRVTHPGALPASMILSASGSYTLITTAWTYPVPVHMWTLALCAKSVTS
jgi:hypothetical protein